METNESTQMDALLLGEIQVLLSEKRTALSSMRTGIAVFALPLSVLSVLIATSRYYSIGKVMPLLLLNLGLVVLGSWLVFHSIGRLHHYDPHPRADPEISVARRGCRLTQTNVAAFSAVGASRVRELGNKGMLASGSARPAGLLFNSSARRRSWHAEQRDSG
jgi:hypothetical protein